MPEFKLSLHTILITVGPSHCGKSTFLTQFLRPQIDHRLNVQYISSDEIRRDILGQKLHKYHPLMMESSKQAFELLYKKKEMVTSYPINA